MTRHILGVALVLGVLGACSGGGNRASTGPSTSATTPGASPTSSEKPVPAENNPPGDIPDSQVYVLYQASGGFDLKVPEGWARTSASGSVTFADKLNSVEVSWYTPQTPPTEDRARRTDVPRLQRTGRAVRLRSIQTVALPAGRCVLITYQANSEPNAVTGRQYRLDVLLYEFFRSGREADLTLSSPVGADNVDPWRIVSQSFRWR